MRTFELAGRRITMDGNPTDPYFDAIEKIAAAESPLATWAAAHLPAGAIIIDAGGNIGLTALLLASLRPHGHVHVFEAMPENVAYLRRNLALNDVRNCTVVAAALGDAPGRLALAGAGSAAHVVAGVDQADSATVPVIPLDDYARDQRLERIDFIKLDVEGYEPAALAGAAGLIERFRPPIYMEFNSWCLAYVHGFNPFAFAHALWDAFDASRIGPDGDAVPLPDVNRFLHDNAVLHGAVDDVLLRLKGGGRVPARAASIRGYGEMASERAAMAAEKAAVARVRQLELELASMRRSSSWRLTAPLRAVAQAYRNRLDRQGRGSTGSGARR